MTKHRIRFDLPVGALGPQGRRHHDAVIGPINGSIELAAAELDNPFAWGIDVLVESLARLGGLDAAQITAHCVGTLLPADRDFALLQLDRITFGDVRFQTLVCPHDGCGERLDVRLELSTVEAAPAPAALQVDLAGPRGEVFTARLPTIADQAAIYDAPEGERGRALLTRCVAPPELAALDDLGTEALGSLSTELLSALPTLDVTLEVTCVECGRPFSYRHEPADVLRHELAASRRALLQEVHVLASRYHWSFGDILALPRPLRREFLGILDDAASGRSRAAPPRASQ